MICEQAIDEQTIDDPTSSLTYLRGLGAPVKSEPTGGFAVCYSPTRALPLTAARQRKDPPAMTGAPERANRGQTVESIISKSRIQIRKAHMILRQFHCESLAAEFQIEGLPMNRNSGLVFPWDAMQKESQLLQLILDLLERRERKGVAAR